MPQIVVEDLVKTFHVAERAPGLWGALRGVVRRRHREVRALVLPAGNLRGAHAQQLGQHLGLESQISSGVA